MAKMRTVRLNSLLKEVISEVIHKDIHHNPYINEFITVTRVEITSDLHYAKVYVSILGKEEDKEKTLHILRELAGFIAVHASKKVVMRYFPSLDFVVDTGLEKQMRIEELLHKISEERKTRPHSEEESTT